MSETSPVAVVDRIVAVLLDGGAQSYLGEPVTQLAHALQAAALAEAAKATDALVVAALLHDIGHLLPATAGQAAGAGDNVRHEDIGDRFLARHFGDAVTEPVRLHVAAKRYLCATAPAYAETLSVASRESLVAQGGPMTAAETRAFVKSLWAGDAVALRRWDEAAKVAGLKVPGLSHYRARIERTMGRP